MKHVKRTPNQTANKAFYAGFTPNTDLSICAIILPTRLPSVLSFALEKTARTLTSYSKTPVLVTTLYPEFRKIFTLPVVFRTFQLPDTVLSCTQTAKPHRKYAVMKIPVFMWIGPETNSSVSKLKHGPQYFQNAPFSEVEDV